MFVRTLMQVSKTLVAPRTSAYIRHVRLASTGLKPAAPSLQYKGRIPGPEKLHVEAAPEPVVIPESIRVPIKPEKTKEQKYSEASRRFLMVMCATPILIVTSYYLYRRCKSYYQACDTSQQY